MRRCPACGLPREDDEEEFCPVDGRRLVDPPDLTLATLSHTGHRRAQNQDAVVAAASSPGEPPWAVLIVCDGVSTSPLSAQAARFVAAHLSGTLQGLIKPTLLPVEEPEKTLRDAILRAHRGLCDEASSWDGASPPGTTVVAALLQGQRLTVGWVGDSRAYWFSRGESRQLTTDHSWLSEVVRRGELTEEEALSSPHAHAITRCLGPLEGASSDAEPEVQSCDLATPGVLLLCTDGLWNYAPALAQLQGLVAQDDHDASAIARRLVDHALLRGGGDNVSVAVYRHKELNSAAQPAGRRADEASMLSRKIDAGDDEFPPVLRTLTPPPEALWLRGVLPARPAVAIVGTRTPSPEGERFAFELAATLARAGWVVWSGGALGIDHQAHEGALSVEGLTVLVAGGGLDRPYPPVLAPLWPRVQERGALLAVVPDEHPPLRWTFFARNAVLAALTDALVLIEGPVQSGARNAAAVARRLGRPVWIGAQAPWSPFAPTVREELRLGARLLLHPDDLLASLSAPEASLASASPLTAPSSASLASSTVKAPRKPTRSRQLPLPTTSAASPSTTPTSPTPNPSPPPLTGLQQRLLEAVKAGAAHLDALCDALDDPPPEILRQATLLQLEGLLAESQVGFYIPTHRS